MAATVRVQSQIWVRKLAVPWLLCGVRRYASSNFKAADLQLKMTQEPHKKPDASKPLVFGKTFTDHMLMVEWDERQGWGRPRIQPFQHLKLHPACSALHYSQQLFEGLKAFRARDRSVRLFRPWLNMDRMLRSAVRLSLPGGAARVHPPARGSGQGLGPGLERCQPLRAACAPRERALARCRQSLESPPLRHSLSRGHVLLWRYLETCVPPGGSSVHPGLGGRGRRLQGGRELRAHSVRAAGGQQEGLRPGALAVRARSPAHRGGQHEHLHLLDPRGWGAGTGDPPGGWCHPARSGQTESAGPGSDLGRVPGGGAQGHHAGGNAGAGGASPPGGLWLWHRLPGVPCAQHPVPGQAPPHSHHGARTRACPPLPEGAELNPVRSPRPQVDAPGVTLQAVPACPRIPPRPRSTQSPAPTQHLVPVPDPPPHG
uniref:branched-chain-amino-acid transaminase n=1 Tax=Rousettus aegyptiacus TaxID=9407 RepID=A0A7J8CE73_ROUAE|nr:branched chain amino acid transaminase 2 [Rousettus aegyptiacus]